VRLAVTTSPPFSPGALRALAGPQAFERGVAYERQGRVNIESADDGHVRAVVSGTREYRTEVRRVRSGEIRCDCTCPAIGNPRPACKHVVAAALAANKAVARRPGAAARVRRYLEGKGAAELAAMLAGLAKGDPRLLDRLDAEAVDALEDDTTADARLRERIETTVAAHGARRVRRPEAWLEAVCAALSDLRRAAASRPALALGLAEFAVGLLEGAAPRFEDPDEFLDPALALARDAHLAAASAAPPDPARLARFLFELEAEGVRGTFSGACDLYAAALGQAGAAEYRRLAREAWDKLPARGPDTRGEPPARQDHLMAILDRLAQRDGDDDARVALRGKDLSTPGRYLALVQFCLDRGRAEQALRAAQEGLWTFEDNPPADLAEIAAGLLDGAGRREEAVACLARALATRPAMRLYRQLAEIGGPKARTRAIKSLAEAARGGTRSAADLAVRVLAEEGRIDEAWGAARRGTSTDVLRELAAASEATRPADALAAYQSCVEAFLAEPERHEREATDLVERMSSLQDPEHHAAYVAGLLGRHARRTYFCMLLRNPGTRKRPRRAGTLRADETAPPEAAPAASAPPTLPSEPSWATQEGADSGADEIEGWQCLEARRALGLNGREMAEAAGVGISTLSDFEKDRRRPTRQNREAIARAIARAGVDVATLVAPAPRQPAQTGRAPAREVPDTPRAVAARKVSPETARRMSRHEAESALGAIRFASTGGTPECRHCGSRGSTWLARRRCWRCHGCDRQYTPTSGTAFASSKLPPEHKLLGTVLVAAGRVPPTPRLAGELGIAFKPASLLLRNAAEFLAGEAVTGLPRDVPGKTPAAA
jgi:transcriptional regulator with XRE-family HTH domain